MLSRRCSTKAEKRTQALRALRDCDRWILSMPERTYEDIALNQIMSLAQRGGAPREKYNTVVRPRCPRTPIMFRQ